MNVFRFLVVVGVLAWTVIVGLASFIVYAAGFPYWAYLLLLAALMPLIFSLIFSFLRGSVRQDITQQIKSVGRGSSGWVREAIEPRNRAFDNPQDDAVDVWAFIKQRMERSVPHDNTFMKLKAGGNTPYSQHEIIRDREGIPLHLFQVHHRLLEGLGVNHLYILFNPRHGVDRYSGGAVEKMRFLPYSMDYVYSYVWSNIHYEGRISLPALEALSRGRL